MNDPGVLKVGSRHIAGIVGVDGMLVVFLIVVTYNNVVALQRRCERAWANIDVALKQRYDQLPNLVAAVRGAMVFEEQVLEAVTQARAAYEPDAPIHDQAVVSEQTSSAVRSLFATVEDYPELTDVKTPEWSHISSRDKARWTRALVPILRDRMAEAGLSRPEMGR